MITGQLSTGQAGRLDRLHGLLVTGWLPIFVGLILVEYGVLLFA